MQNGPPSSDDHAAGGGPGHSHATSRLPGLQNHLTLAPCPGFSSCYCTTVLGNQQSPLFFLKKKQFNQTLKNKAGTWTGARMKPLFLVSTPHCTHLLQDVGLICAYFIFVRASVNKWAGVRAPSLPTRSSFCLLFAGASHPLHLISVVPSSVGLLQLPASH